MVATHEWKKRQSLGSQVSETIVLGLGSRKLRHQWQSLWEYNSKYNFFRHTPSHYSGFTGIPAAGAFYLARLLLCSTAVNTTGLGRGGVTS